METKFLESVTKSEHDRASDAMQQSASVLEATTESGETCMHLAVANMDERMVSMILARDRIGLADRPDRKGVRPVTTAIRFNQPKIFDMLVDKGANLKTINPVDKSTLLHNAVWAGHEAMVEKLLRTGIFSGELLEAEDDEKRTALHYASFRASEEVCRLLIEAGAQGVANADKYDLKPAKLAERTGRRASKDYLEKCEAAFSVGLAAVKMKSKLKSKEIAATGVEDA